MQTLNQPPIATDAALSQLQEIDADLAGQEAESLHQLESVQAKRQHLQAVIHLFSSATSSQTVATGEEAIAAATETVEATAVAPVAELDSAVSIPEPSHPASADPSPQQPQKSRKSRIATEPTQKRSKRSQSKTGSKQNQDIQDYLRSEFEQVSLAQALSRVLHQQPDAVLGIPDIIHSMLEDDTPKAIRKEASKRLATLLSVGVKQDKWYRGKTGHYSLSQSAAEADIAS
ncbi:hypothetical protein IQ268_17005 [Oculatella sp. LEGE 06141]|uniref:hypothetical protein n=1 Tax=Oculatella sp. LEGE 06141 TaxID=1828648 RepID=UPI00188109AD|nr:hypothetical protein [Oculatella sp. LEGE 06141]MBE9180264.1 hypothetical protein [Oculatella sp. LEGE 06141]